MPELGIDIIKFVVGGLLGSLITFQKMKWKLRQDRKSVWAEKRLPIYSEGLKFVHEIEQNRADPEELDNILVRWKKWYPSNSIYLPESVNNAILEAMWGTHALSINLHNRKEDIETSRIFREKLHTARDFLNESKDIGWLPEDLR